MAYEAIYAASSHLTRPEERSAFDQFDTLTGTEPVPVDNRFDALRTPDAQTIGAVILIAIHHFIEMFRFL